MILPPPRKMGRPKGSRDSGPRKNKKQKRLADAFIESTSSDDEDEGKTSSSSRHRLPADPKEREDALMPHRVMARPIVAGLSMLCEEMDTKPLNSAEEASCTEAFAALIWKYMHEATPEAFAALALLGIGVPRVPQAIRNRRKKRQAALQSGTENKVRVAVSASDAPPKNVSAPITSAH